MCVTAAILCFPVCLSACIRPEWQDAQGEHCGLGTIWEAACSTVHLYCTAMNRTDDTTALKSTEHTTTLKSTELN